MGGADQWGNITAGLELIRRTAGGGADESPAHGIAYKLLLSPVGREVRQERGRRLGLAGPGADDAVRVLPVLGRTSTTATWAPTCAGSRPGSRDEIEALDAAVAERPEAREAQRRLAFDVTARVHGEAAAGGGRARCRRRCSSASRSRTRRCWRRCSRRPAGHRGRASVAGGRGRGAARRDRPGAVARRGPAPRPGRRDHRERRPDHGPRGGPAGAGRGRVARGPGRASGTGRSCGSRAADPGRRRCLAARGATPGAQPRSAARGGRGGRRGRPAARGPRSASSTRAWYSEVAGLAGQQRPRLAAVARRPPRPPRRSWRRGAPRSPPRRPCGPARSTPPSRSVTV